MPEGNHQVTAESKNARKLQSYDFHSVVFFPLRIAIPGDPQKLLTRLWLIHFAKVNNLSRFLHIWLQLYWDVCIVMPYLLRHLEKYLW